MDKAETYPNIDERCAHYASVIVSQRGTSKEAGALQTVIRNALGVMREQGLYAFKLFVDYRAKIGGNLIWEQTRALWQDSVVGPLLSNAQNDLDGVRTLTTDLNDLLLAREITERMLIYALYGLKATG